MNIRIRQENDIVLLYLEGIIDINSGSLIETTGQLARDGYLKLLCDLKNIDVVDSYGLSILAIMYKNVVNRNGIVKFSNVPRQVRELFKIEKFDLVFDVYDNEDAAIRAFEMVSRIDKLYMRRRFKRLECRNKVIYESTVASAKKKYEGHVLNIGGLGVYIYTKHILPVGSTMRLEIFMDERTVNVEAVVIWVADKDVQPHLYPGMGVKFSKINYDTQSWIVEYVEKNMTSRSSF